MTASDSVQDNLNQPYPLKRDAIDSYRENGYVKLKQVFSPGLLEHYRKEIAKKVEDLNTQYEPMEKRSTCGKAFLQVMNLWTKSSEVREFVFGKRLARIAAELLECRGVRIYHDQALCKEPGGGITPWHADQYYWPVSSEKMITAWIPHQDTPLEMGPISFCEKSHRLQLGRALEISDESELILKQAVEKFRLEESPFVLGDVSFHAGWTIHRAGANTLVQCALIAQRYSSYLQQFYLRIQRRRGGKANIALARKFLGVIYYTLKNHWPSRTSPISSGPPDTGPNYSMSRQLFMGGFAKMSMTKLQDAIDRIDVCFKHLFVLFAMIGILTASMVAQTTTGSIYGTVSDTSGAVIRNAAITATNVQTGETHAAQSNSSGNYEFPSLVPGNYVVSAKSSGFQTEIQRGIRLDANRNVQVRFPLHPGTASQSVNVTANTTLVDTRESQLGETVDQKRIEDLPLNDREAYSLVQIVPGVTNFGAGSIIGDNTGSTFSVNGIRSNFDSVYLDGGYDNSTFRNGGNLIPNPDALQEFRLLTSNFDAGFGRDPGGVLNIITRSGTNRYHGLAYDYLRNNVLNAKNYFNNNVTPLKQNQFGGNFGGPIRRNKAFFFLSYEGLRIRTPEVVSSTLTTLTPAEAKGDFSSPTIKPTPVLPAGTNCGTTAAPVICPAALDPVAQNLLKFVPLEDPTTGRPPEQTAAANTNADQGLVRVDYQLNKRHKLSVMFFTSRGRAADPTDSGNNQIIGFSGVSTYTNQTNATASDQWIISPSMLNSLNLFYSLNHYITALLYDYTWSTLGSQVAEGGPLSDQPLFTINGYWQMGMGGDTGARNDAQQSFGASDALIWMLGHHTVKVGGSFIWNKYSTSNSFLGSGKLTFSGSTTKNALADFLLGKANSFTQNSGGFVRVHAPDPALFAQDNWRVGQRLTLNLGLRWELFPPFTGQNNLGTFEPNVQSARYPTAPIGLLTSGDPGVPDGVLHTSWTRFAPRVGFAYDVFGNGQTSLRGAYGIFYATDQVTFAINLEQQPFFLSVITNDVPNLVTPYAPDKDPFPYIVNPQNPNFTSGASVAAMPANNSSTPYVQEFNLNFEQQLGVNWGMQLSYVGNVSHRFYLLRDENMPAYIPGASTSTAGLNARRPYQPTPSTYTFGQIGEMAPVSNGSYNSFQATLTRRFTHRFSLLASYVWSKAMDDVSSDPANATSVQLVDSNNVAYDWGLSGLDVPQRFVASYLWSAPNIRVLGWVGKQVLSGWQLNGITTLSTGSPFTVTSGVDTNLDGNTNDRPDQVGDPILSGHRSRTAKMAEFFNTAAFAQLPPDVPYGDVKRDSLIGPGLVNTDFSAFKIFTVRKNSTLQFRGSLFNLFNNVNLSNPNGGMTSPQFGQITGSGSPRIVQFALRYAF